jgi:hypothetical protein
MRRLPAEFARQIPRAFVCLAGVNSALVLPCTGSSPFLDLVGCHGRAPTQSSVEEAFLFNIGSKLVSGEKRTVAHICTRAVLRPRIKAA